MTRKILKNYAAAPQAPRKTAKQKIVSAAAAVAVACGLGVPLQQAYAGCCGETAVLMAILEAMEADFEMLYMYMISGEGDIGTGVVGTISGNARAKMSHDETQGGNQDAHYAAVDREREGEAVALKRNVDTLGDPRSCSEDAVKNSYGLRGANADAAQYSAKAAGVANRKVAEHLAGTQPSDTNHAAILIDEMKQYASPADVTAGRAQSEGSAGMPDANIRAQSLFVPAYDYTKPDTAGKQPLTFSDEQQKAANLALDNIVARFSPPALPKAVEDTPAGKMYVAKTKIFNARMSPAVMALSGISARRSPAELGSNSDQWQQHSSEYGSIFPNVPKPDKPSEMELLRLEVMRRYAGSKWMSDLKSSSDPAKVAAEQAMTDSVKLKVLYEIHTRLEENSAIQAAILAQLVNPVSRQELDAAAQTAYRNKQ